MESQTKEKRTMRICPSCEKQVASDSNNCPQCGTLIAGEAFMRCSNGHILSENSSFCAWCGVKVGGGNDSPTVSLNDQTGRKTVVVNDTVPMNDGQASPRRTMAINRGTVIKRPGGDQDVSEPKIVGFLVSYTLEKQGFFFPLREGRQNIGSSNSAKLTIKDQSLSADHAIILYRNDRFIFEDKLSSNGSFINGEEAIGQKELRHGDRLVMGSHTFILIGVPQDVTE